MCKWVINQDRDEIFKVKDVCCLHMGYVYYETKLIAFNLIYNGKLLGTFDTIEDCIFELTKIINSKVDFYVISGYSE